MFEQQTDTGQQTPTTTTNMIGQLTIVHAAGIAVFVRLALNFLPEKTAANVPEWLQLRLWSSCLILTLFIWSLDRLIFWPRFRTPLLGFPRMKSTNIMAELPRGKTPLAWFAANPKADAVVMCTPTGRCVLFPSSPEALRDIMSTNSYHWEKPFGIRAFLGRVIGFGLIMSEGDAHKKQRKALTPPFNIRNIRALYPLMWEKVGVLVDQLNKEMAVGSKKGKGVVEVSHWASRLTLDIIGPAALSRDFATLTSDDDPVAEAFGEILDPSPELVTFMVANMFVPQFICTRVPVRANKLIWTNVTKLRELCRTILSEKHDKLKKLEEGSEEDILQNIIESGQFTDDEVVDQMLTFLAAGHETTASALTWGLYLLAQDQEIQEKLRQEIRENVTPPATHQVLEGLPWLNGVCEEIFRLYPTVPLTIRQAVEDTVLCGVSIPKGTDSLIVPYAINRNPHFWGQDAEKFTPGRWIDKTEDGERPNKHGGAHSNFCETTFLHGARSCIGRDFAKAELRCAIAGLIGYFKVELADPDREVIIGGTVTTKPVGGLDIKFTPLPGWNVV